MICLLNRHARGARLAAAACCLATVFGLPGAAWASDYSVINTNSAGAGSLALALAQAQSDAGARIDIQSGLGVITLAAPLPEIQNNLVIDGNGNTISGSNAFRIFFVNAPGATVLIEGLTLAGGKALGGKGGGGYGAGGGGAGLGGAIFLNTGALTVSGVSFSGNLARGGDGAAGFDDALNPQFGGGGGGGGLDFAGGDGGSAPVNGGEVFIGPGGGGGALTSAGALGNPNASRAGAGGGVNGGQGGALALSGNAGNGASPSLADGGGGGGGMDSAIGNGGNGGNGSDFSGGGGAGSSGDGNSGGGGNGGFGGGGGGGALCQHGVAYPGGNGGFGGGGGGGGQGNDATGGTSSGGFGGGSGASGATGNAGGGLAAGGAIFARLGSFLTIQDCNFNGDGLIGGNGDKPAVGGAVLGQAVFLGASANFSISEGNTNVLSETIGGGNDSNAEGSLTKSGPGTLILTQSESYAGNTTVTAGTLAVSNNFLPSPAIAIGSGAVLEYKFTNRMLEANAIYTGGGTLRDSGTGDVVFGPGVINVNFSPGAWVDVQSGRIIGSSSYGGNWTSNLASLNIASNAVFDAVEAGHTASMQIDALTGGGTFEGGYFGVSTVAIGAAGGSGVFNGTFQDDAASALAIVKTGAGIEILSGYNNHSGGTAVHGGTLVVNGTIRQGVVTVSGGMLSGAGRIGGAVSIGQNGTLAPGAPLGILTMSNSLRLAGNTIMALNSNANSQVAGLSSITYGGTLTVTNLGGPLSPGQAFTLFSAASESGNFTAISGGAGPGLGFSFNPSNGVLSVTSLLPVSPTNITISAHSGAAALSWPVNYTGWILQAQTNPPSMGISGQWADVPGSYLVDTMSFTIDPSNSVFFRLRFP
ncbi:MAG TPA: autotransporter-associated beta strand repeat-containing protein [Verrucomicrobiae bacterium]|jgi:autotransporter-associated beta strand protein